MSINTWLFADVETTCSEEKTVREKFVALVAAVSVSILPLQFYNCLTVCFSAVATVIVPVVTVGMRRAP